MLLVDTLDRMRRNPEGRKVVLHLHLWLLLPATARLCALK
jgi:hypothetical protein